MLPHFLAYYGEIAEKIVIFDNMSQDRSVEIIQAHPKTELRRFDTGGKCDNLKMTEFKNTAYKECRGEADFVIAIDMDEFVYHPDLMRVLADYKARGITFPRITGYDMVSFRFPRGGRLLTEAVPYGRQSSGYSKRCIFNPVIDINYQPGAHRAEPQGNVVENETAELKLLHYHFIGYWRCLGKNKRRRVRYYADGPQKNFGFQFKWGSWRTLAKFLLLWTNAENVYTGRKTLLARTVGPVVFLAKKLFWKDEFDIK